MSINIYTSVKSNNQVIFFKILLLFSGISLLFQHSLFAQQEPQFTLNRYTQSYVNPGAYGLQDGISITGVFRQQWTGLKDENNISIAPQTILFLADSPIRILHGGIGVSIVQDKYGYFSDMGVKLGYSYHRNLGAGKLGIGVLGNFINKKLDFSKLIWIDENDPVKSDAAAEGVMYTDISAGIHYIHPKYFVSFASSQLLETSKSLSGGENQSGYYSNRRHYYLSGGYNLVIPALGQYTFTPGMTLKTDGAIIQADFNTIVNFNKKVWGGLNYRLGDTFGLMAGMFYKEFEIGYAYDFPMSRVSGFGSHDIIIRYLFKIEKDKVRKGYHNTRFL